MLTFVKSFGEPQKRPFFGPLRMKTFSASANGALLGSMIFAKKMMAVPSSG
jgi:hypothetical protein